MGCVEGVLPLGADLGCGAVVHRSRGVQPDPGVTVLMVVVAEERLAESAASARDPNASGKTGAYLRVLNAASL